MTRIEDGPVSEAECSLMLQKVLSSLDRLSETAPTADAQRYNLVCSHLQHGLDLLNEGHSA